MLVDHLEHLGRRQVLELAPAVVLVGPAPVVDPVGEHGVLHRLAEGSRLVLGESLEVVEALDEEEIRQLLDHLERVGDAS